MDKFMNLISSERYISRGVEFYNLQLTQVRLKPINILFFKKKSRFQKPNARIRIKVISFAL